MYMRQGFAFSAVHSLTGFDPWDVSARGLADLLETEQNPSHSHGMVNGEERGKEGGVTSNPASLPTMDATTNLSWQDELKTVFPNVNISFGGTMYILNI